MDPLDDVQDELERRRRLDPACLYVYAEPAGPGRVRVLTSWLSRRDAEVLASAGFSQLPDGRCEAVVAAAGYSAALRAACDVLARRYRG